MVGVGVRVTVEVAVTETVGVRVGGATLLRVPQLSSNGRIKAQQSSREV
jgi:hypothetical protein